MKASVDIRFHHPSNAIKVSDRTMIFQCKNIQALTRFNHSDDVVGSNLNFLTWKIPVLMVLSQLRSIESDPLKKFNWIGK